MRQLPQPLDGTTIEAGFMDPSWTPVGGEDTVCVGASLASMEMDTFDQDQEEDDRTTLVIRGMPTAYTRADLRALIDMQGFKGQYDFIYLPMEVGSPKNFSYAFVNFVSPKDAQNFMQHFQSFSDWGTPWRKAATVEWSHAQGLEEHIRRYRNSPVMHADVPDECKPQVFDKGNCADFPAPTKKIPSLRRLRTRKGWKPNDLGGKVMELPGPGEEWSSEDTMVTTTQEAGMLESKLLETKMLEDTSMPKDILVCTPTATGSDASIWGSEDTLDSLTPSQRSFSCGKSPQTQKELPMLCVIRFSEACHIAKRSRRDPCVGKGQLGVHNFATLNNVKQ